MNLLLGTFALALLLMLMPYPAQLRRIAVVGCGALAAVFALLGAGVVVNDQTDGIAFGSAFLVLAAGYLIRVYLIWRGLRQRRVAATGMP